MLNKVSLRVFRNYFYSYYSLLVCFQCHLKMIFFLYFYFLFFPVSIFSFVLSIEKCKFLSIYWFLDVAISFLLTFAFIFVNSYSNSYNLFFFFPHCWYIFLTYFSSLWLLHYLIPWRSRKDLFVLRKLSLNKIPILNFILTLFLFKGMGRLKMFKEKDSVPFPSL